jgi:catechol 2,3-dioxygenase-like lactoylglutathione lyase family enzyme
VSVEFNHTIIPSHDRQVSAEFLAGLLGLELGQAWGPFLPLQVSNGVTLDFTSLGPDAHVPMMHYAFLVSEEEFDGIFERIKEAELKYFADPAGKQVGEINYNHGGRGVYFYDPSGHGMEVITRPYGSVG